MSYDIRSLKADLESLRKSVEYCLSELKKCTEESEGKECKKKEA